MAFVSCCSSLEGFSYASASKCHTPNPGGGGGDVYDDVYNEVVMVCMMLVMVRMVTCMTKAAMLYMTI